MNEKERTGARKYKILFFQLIVINNVSIDYSMQALHNKKVQTSS
jgi:hypothetical protein